MSDAQKIPLSRSLNAFAQRKAVDEIAKRWMILPGTVAAVSGAIVTVNFQVPGLTLPQTTMAVAMSKYVRLPIQVGDTGIAIQASAYTGTITGLGTGSPTPAALQANLSAMQWLPVGSKSWAAVNPNAVFIEAPDGAVIQDENGETVFTLTPSALSVESPSGTITLSAGGHTVTISSSGVVIDGVTFATHEHEPGTYVVDDSPVTGQSGAVVSDS